MNELSQRIDELESVVAALSARLARLEADEAPTRREDLPPGDVDFALMERLQKRAGAQFEADGLRGSIVYAGSVQMHQGGAIWHSERPFPFLVQQPPEQLANIMAALGHPQRVQLVQQLMHGPQDRQTLQDALSGNSTGQLYHHLNTLMEAGVIMQRRRGVYELIGHAIIPLLAMMAAALDMHTKSIEE